MSDAALYSGFLSALFGLGCIIAIITNKWDRNTVFPGGVNSALAITFGSLTVWGLIIAVRLKRGAARVKYQGVYHYTRFFQAVSALFTLFGIEPSPLIGKLSKERFVALIGEALTAQLAYKDTLLDFRKLGAEKKFLEMHAAALEWGLCDPQYDRYDPNREQGQKK